MISIRLASFYKKQFLPILRICVFSDLEKTSNLDESFVFTQKKYFFFLL